MDVNLVLVPVTVTDRAGRIVNGLRPEHFTILEEGTPQRIVSFSSENAPASIGLVLDVSGSMKRSIATACSAIRSLLKAADRSDEALLLTFASRPELRADFTGDFDHLQRLLRSATPGGKTALIDTVYFALDQMRKARHSRKALVIASDGADNHSRYSKGELMGKALESDVQIHTIGIWDPPRNKKPIELAEDKRGLLLLEHLARATGGLHFVIRGADEAERPTEKIGLALRNQYVIGYHPDGNGRSPGWRKIQVKLDLPDLRAYSRSRYFAPGP